MIRAKARQRGGQGQGSKPCDLDLGGSIMGLYLKAIQAQLMKELDRSSTENVHPWLVNELKKYDWTIVYRLRFICQELGLEYTEAYYREVKVWLPNERWGNSCMPTRSNCKLSEFVIRFSFPTIQQGECLHLICVISS